MRWVGERNNPGHRNNSEEARCNGFALVGKKNTGIVILKFPLFAGWYEVNLRTSSLLSICILPSQLWGALFLFFDLLWKSISFSVSQTCLRNISVSYNRSSVAALCGALGSTEPKQIPEEILLHFEG